MWEIICTNALYGTFAFIFTLTKDGTFGLCEPRHEKTALCINVKTKAHISYRAADQCICLRSIDRKISHFFHHTLTIVSLLPSPMFVSDLIYRDAARVQKCTNRQHGHVATVKID